jgi:Predicted transcription regulator containing HTH domain
MAEQNLKQADLVQYLGTPSRVSEVLSGKRQLTVDMVKNLSIGLGISTDTLLGVSRTIPTEKEIDWKKFPIKEMMSRNWIKSILDKSSTTVEKAVEEFIMGSGLHLNNVSFKKTLYGDAVSVTTQYALYAWLARVVQRAREKENPNEFDHTKISSGFLKELAQLSRFEDGPIQAVNLLEKNGISVVFETLIKGTSLDGAAFKDTTGRPIIGMTLRRDQIDSFWFTLLHEVAHIWKHVNMDDAFLDNHDRESEDRREAEASRIARESFIPRVLWRRSDAYLQPTKESIYDFAFQLKIHPAIVAGRIQYDKDNYGLFSDLTGKGMIRKVFFDNSNNQWSKK